MLAHMLPMNTQPSDPRRPNDDQGNIQDYYPQQPSQGGPRFQRPPPPPAPNRYLQQRRFEMCDVQRSFQADARAEHDQQHRYPPNHRLPFALSAPHVPNGNLMSSWQRSSYTPMPLLEQPIIPRHNDVLLGRGGKNHLHPGNEQLRQMAHVFRNEYVASSKKAKSKLSRDLVKYVHALNPPGRFIHPDEKTKMWKVVCDEKAREKTSQCLRDAVGMKGHAAYMKPRTEEEDAMLREQMKDFNAAAVVHALQKQGYQSFEVPTRQAPPIEAHSGANMRAHKNSSHIEDDCSSNLEELRRQPSQHGQGLYRQPPQRGHDSPEVVQGRHSFTGIQQPFESRRGFDDMPLDEIIFSEDPDGDDFGLVQEMERPGQSLDDEIIDETVNPFVTEFG